MAAHDRTAAAIMSHIAIAADGAVVGLALAYMAVKSILQSLSSRRLLRKLKQAPSVPVSNLRSVLSDATYPSFGFLNKGKLVIVRGSVEEKWTLWKILGWPNILKSQQSGHKGVVLQRTRRCLYYLQKAKTQESSLIKAVISHFATLPKGFFAWMLSWKKKESSSIKTVPFNLVDAGSGQKSDCLLVNLKGSKHPLPLETVYRHLEPITSSPYTSLPALLGHESPVGLLDEEKMLRFGKEITAVGICRLKDEKLELKSCKSLPFFLTEMTKDQMLADLAFRSKFLLWSGVVLGSLSVGILGYAFLRNWIRWNKKRHRGQKQHGQPQRQSSIGGDASNRGGRREEENGNNPDAHLCVICLTRSRLCAFLPCGHLLCCQHCARLVESETSPKCPLCRQQIQSSVRIYSS